MKWLMMLLFAGMALGIAGFLAMKMLHSRLARILVVVSAALLGIFLLSDIVGFLLGYRSIYQDILDTGVFRNRYQMKLVSGAITLVLYTCISFAIRNIIKFRFRRGMMLVSLSVLIFWSSMAFLTRNQIFEAGSKEIKSVQNYIHLAPTTDFPKGEIKLLDKEQWTDPETGIQSQTVTPTVAQEYKQQEEERERQPKTGETPWYKNPLWLISITVSLFLLLILVKESSGSGWKFFKPILGFALAVGLALWVGFSVYRHLFPTTSSSILSRTPAGTNMSHGVPIEIALPIIADCESGGGVPGAAHHFGPDGKPLRNKEGSSAIGKYQILASDHEEKAKKMGFDIQTEEGNESYAKYLYTNEGGTKHWEADPRSVTCWEPKLRAYTWGGEAVSFVILAPVNRYGENYNTPKWGHTSIDGLGNKKYRVLWNNEIEEDFPRAEGIPLKNPKTVSCFRLKSRESETTPIIVKFF